MIKKGAFGVVKPLPGQAGYKVTETDQLEKEAKDMEMRLRMLQERMQQQKIEDENIAKPGGSRWNSARVDKGGTSSYGKELQEKYKKKRDAEGGGDPAFWTSSQRASQKPKSCDIKSKDVNLWTAKEVGIWLNALLLGQYSGIFESNEITGAILLEVSLQDLDYMDIKALGHRKVILNGIEDLRKNRRIPADMKVDTSDIKPTDSRALLSQSVKAEPAKIEKPVLLSKSMTVESLSQQVADSKKASHWSDIEPLSKSEISNPSVVPSNAADEDFYDEEAERLAFQNAVMEWRRANNAPSQPQESSIQVTAETTSEKTSLWNNPFSCHDEDQLENDNSNIKKTHVEIVREYSKPNDSAKSTNQTTSRTALADGDLDEEAERLEFMKAVASWRSGGSKDNNEVKIVSIQASTNSTVPIVTGRMVADNLARELEVEQERVTQSFKDQLEKARQAQSAVKKVIVSESKPQIREPESIEWKISHDSQDSPRLEMAADLEEFEEESDISGSYFDESMVRDTSHRKKSVSDSKAVLDHKRSAFEDNVQARSLPVRNIDEDKGIEFQSFADIKLIESTIGQTTDSRDGEYIVEELSDDE